MFVLRERPRPADGARPQIGRQFAIIAGPWWPMAFCTLGMIITMPACMLAFSVGGAQHASVTRTLCILAVVACMVLVVAR